MKFAAIVLLICPAICLALKPVNKTIDDQSCPVVFDNFYTAPALGTVAGFSVKFKNRTDKVIIGSDFGLDVMNAVGDFVPYFQTIDVADKVKPGKSAHYIGRLIPVQQYRLLAGYRVYIRKIAFADGTVWQDDGTMKCQIARDDRRR